MGTPFLPALLPVRLGTLWVIAFSELHGMHLLGLACRSPGPDLHSSPSASSIAGRPGSPLRSPQTQATIAAKGSAHSGAEPLAARRLPRPVPGPASLSRTHTRHHRYSSRAQATKKPLRLQETKGAFAVPLLFDDAHLARTIALLRDNGRTRIGLHSFASRTPIDRSTPGRRSANHTARGLQPVTPLLYQLAWPTLPVRRL